MALENILSQEIVQKLGWTLLHFIWQAAAVALLLTILLALLRKAAANVRYIVACAALGLIVLLPIVTMQLVPVLVSQPKANIEPAPAPVIPPAQQIKEIPALEISITEGTVPHETAGTVYKVSWKQRAADLLEPALPYFVTGWLLGVFGLSLWHLGGWAQLQRLRKKMIKQVDESLSATMHRLSHRLGVKSAVQILESALVQVPTVVGWLRPVILLPASALTGLTTEQLEALLAHELAHIRRYDYLFNILQTVVETLGFYHPAVWWISHKIRAERENCCDDLAVTISGDRVSYACALTSMEEIRAGRNELAVAAAGGNLFGRIRRLVSKDSNDLSRTSWIPLVITILLIAIITIPATLAISTQSKSKEPEQETEIAGDVEKTFSGGADMLTSIPLGPVGRRALLFDGVDDCMHVPASPTLQFKPPFTIEMWIKPDFSEGKRIKASGEDFLGLSLLRKGNKHHDEGKQVGGLAMLLHPSRVGSVYFVDDISAIMVQTGMFEGDGSALTAHPGWLHISASCTREEYIPVPDEPLVIGEAIEPPTILPPFKGQIAEIRIWNKVLNEEDSHRHGQTSLTGSEPNLVACWDFEHTEGQIVYDISPNGNHAYMGTSPQTDDADPKWIDLEAMPNQADQKTDRLVENNEGSIEGRIIDIDTGRGISGVQLAAVPNSSPELYDRFVCTSGESGAFTIGGLQSGEYLLQGDFPSVDVDVVSGRSTSDVLIGVHQRVTVPAPKETTAEQQRGGQVIIGMRVIEMPADAMKDAFEPNESLSSGLLVRHGYEIAGRLLTLRQEREDIRQITNPQILMIKNEELTINITQETVYISGYESAEGEPGKLTEQIKILEAGWKFKIKAGILENGENVHIALAAKRQKPVFETLQYRPGYDYKIPIRPEIFVTEMTAKNGEPVVIGRLRDGEPAFCFIVTPSAILPERQPEPLLGKKLPEPDSIQNIDSIKQTEGKPTLVCFWDMNQRPSRNLIDELAKRKKELAEKNVAVYLVHTSKVEPAKLKEWLDNQNVPFICGYIEGDAKEILLAWGVKAQPWLILTDQKGVVRAEGFSLEQLNEKLQEKDSNPSLEKEKSNNNLLAKSAVPSAEDKSIVKVDLSVVEVPPGSEVDRETIAEIRNLLGDKIAIPDSPAAADLLRKATEATAAVKDESVGDKRVTQMEFNTLFDLLVSRGYVKILMNPTLEVVEGQTAQIKTDQNSVEVTANVVKDDHMSIRVRAEHNSKVIQKVEGQKPIISRRNFDGIFYINSGQSQIIGGVIDIPARSGEEGNAKGSQTPAGELLCIVTASIITPAVDKPMTRVYDITDLVGATMSRGIVDVMMGGSDNSLGGHVNIPDQAIVIEARNIVNLIMQTIDPNSWYENDPNAKGIITPYPVARPRKLAIYQTLPVHQQIEKFLESRREQTDTTQISIGLRYLYTNVEFLDEVRDSMDIEFAPNTLLDDKQVETLLRASQKKKDIRSLMAPGVTVLNNETARFNTARHVFMSFLDYSKPNNVSQQSTPVPVDTFCSITPHIEDNKDIIIDLIQDIPGLHERIIYDRREMVQSYTETTAITNKRIPNNKTFAFTCDIIKFDQNNQTASPAEKKILIVLIKPTIIVQEEMPRSNAAAMTSNSLRSKGYTAEQADETIYLKSLPEEQPGTDKDKIQIDTSILFANDDFLKAIGLDANSVYESEAWSEHLTPESAAEPNSQTFSLILDELNVNLFTRAIAAHMRTHKGITMLIKPRMLVQDGQTADLSITNEFNYISGYSRQNRPSDEPKPKHDSVKLGKFIKVKPQLTPDKKNIQLEFESEMRELQGLEEHKHNGKYPYQVPEIDVLKISTRCLIPDGKTLLIAGHKITLQVERTSRKPLLSDLPVVGILFNSRDTIKEQRTLLIMVTPSTDIKAPPIPPPINPNDPLIKKLEEKFKRYDEE